MFSTPEILDLIERRRKELGLSQVEVSMRAFGKADNTAIQSLKKGNSPGFDRVAALAEALNLELYFGPPRPTGPVATVILGNEDFTAVPRYDARLSAGPGADNGTAHVVEKLAFRRDWLDRMGVHPAAAVLVPVSGDSMAPGLQDGDLALIDTNRTTPRSGQVYALTDLDGSTRVKRLDLLPTGLILRSDNPAYPVEFRPRDDADRIHIIGHVVWSGHTW